MLSKNLYKVKKKPLAEKRKRAILIALIIIPLFFIGLGVYMIDRTGPADGKKDSVTVQTGNQPLAQSITVYVNASGGLNLRADHDANSASLELIPDKTSLTVMEELNGWYQVTYNGKTGWISKQYTTTTAPATDPTKDWASFSGSGYKIKYEPGWKAQDYGANSTLFASSLVAFSDQDLPTTLPTGSQFIAPVTVAISTQSLADAEKAYSTISGVQTETVTVAGLSADKFTYTSASSSTQMTAIVLAAGGKVFVFSDSGGYADDLLKMAATFTIG
jgi:hypothetical protein